MSKLTQGQRVRIKAEFLDAGEPEIIRVVTEAQDGGRVSVTPAEGQGFDDMRIKPVERLDACMLEIAA